jgi:glutamine amidotransferase
MIGIIDYGMGNLGSVSNACRFLAMDARIITAPAEMNGCDAIVLPGQGAFGDAMAHLNRSGFTPAIRAWLQAGRPYLGLCLGLQLLCASSEEAPGVAGLGWLAGTVRRFRLPPEYKVPHIGWNRVRQRQPRCPLWPDIGDGAFFYFVHSYYVDTPEIDRVAGVTEYGIEFTSVVWAGHVMAVQFHPEKSQQDGLRMLRNFSAWMKAGAVPA